MACLLRSLAQRLAPALLLGTFACNSFNNINLSPFPAKSDRLELRILHSEAGIGTCLGPARAGERILMIPIEGVIASGMAASEGTSPSEIHRILKKASGDPQIKAILLRINSPGGTVTDSDLILHMIRRHAQRKKLPVYAHVDPLAASGGYYVAMAARQLNVVPTGRVGSIGVILQSFSATGLLEKLGLADRSIKSGRNKDTLSPFRDLRPDEREFLQKQIDATHARFVSTVARSRGERIGLERLREIADGRVLTAEQAQAEKLVDSVSFLDEYVKKIKSEQRLGKIEIIAWLPEGTRSTGVYGLDAPREDSPQSLLKRLPGVGLRGLLYLWAGGL